jgi:parallel beta-helix repeat protein
MGGKWRPRVSIRTARFHQFTPYAPAGPAPAIVTKIGNPVILSVAAASGVLSVDLTATHSTPAGHSIILSAVVNGGPTLHVSDSAGNTYNVDNTIKTGSATSSVAVSTHVVSAHNITALPAGGTITIAFYNFDPDVSGTAPVTRSRFVIQAYDASNLSGEIEDVSAGSAATLLTNAQQGTVETRHGNPLYFSAIGIENRTSSAATFTPESGYTQLDTTRSASSGALTCDIASVWKTTTNYGFQTANTTLSSANIFTAVTVAYKAKYPGHGVAGTNTAPAPQTRVITNADQLTTALNLANPGDTLQIGAGTYAGSFKAPGRRGTASQPITVVSASGAMLQGTGTARAYGIWLYKCSYWNISGPMVIDTNLKGIVLDISDHCTIDGAIVQNIKQEGIHLRNESTYNFIQNCTIQDVGLESPGFGEAMYVGSAFSNWGSPTDSASRMPAQQIGFPDKSDNNSFIGNTTRRVPAEAVDVKEGTIGTIIQNNNFDGTGLAGINGAEQWVDVKGQGCVISGNNGTNAGTILKYGFATEYEAPDSTQDPLNRFPPFLSPYVDGFGNLQPGIKLGCDNIFSTNTMDCGTSADYAIAIKSARNFGNVVNIDNIVTSATPLTNSSPIVP